jgi:hypothetical protein
MPLSMYKTKVTLFEKKYHNLLVDMFVYIQSIWDTYETTYVEKTDMNYSNFVRYCYSVTKKYNSY